MQPRRSSTRRISSRTSPRSTSATASATTGSRSWRATPSGSRRRGRRRARDRATRSRKPSSGCATHAQTFFTELAFAHRGAPSRRRRSDGRACDGARARRSLGETRDAAAHLTGALDVLETDAALMAAVRPRHAAAGDADADEGGRRRRRARTTSRRSRRAPATIRDELRLLLRADDDEYVYFVEFRGRGIFLRASPIDVSAIVRDLLLDQMRTTVLTSATLTVDGRFDYVRERLGIRDAEEIRLASEFDFARQAILYLPQRMPDPRSRQFAVAASREVIEILKRTHGRAFVLFTSYATMRAVQAMAEMALDYPIFAQGTRAAIAAAEPVPRDAARGAVRDVELLAGRGRGRRGAELRDRRQAAVRVARRSDHRGAHRRDSRPRRRPVRATIRYRSPSSRCSRGSAASSATGTTAACSPCSIRACGRRATAAASSPLYRPRRSCTTLRASTRFFRPEGHPFSRRRRL